MKILSKTFFFLLISITSFSQERNYSAFRWDIGMLYARPSGFGVGLGFYTEPKYMINDYLSTGLKVELDLLGRAKWNADKTGGGSLAYINSYTGFTDFHLGNGHVRPTFGVGAGLYRLTAIGVSTEDWPEFDRGGKFGIAPRFGLDIWHFRLAADYNFILGQKGRFSGQEVYYDQNHLTIKLGIFFGGGKKSVNSEQ